MMPTRYDDVSGAPPERPFRTKAERALHGEEEEQVPMRTNKDGVPEYVLPGDALNQQLHRHHHPIPGELLDDSEIDDKPDDVREQLEQMTRQVRGLVEQQPRLMALRMAIEALPQANPEDQMQRAKQYLTFIDPEAKSE